MSTPEPAGGAFTWEDLQAEISKVRADEDAIRQQMEQRHQADLAALRQDMAGGPNFARIPAHSGGPGTDIAKTWSLAEQTASRAAEAAGL